MNCLRDAFFRLLPRMLAQKPKVLRRRRKKARLVFGVLCARKEDGRTLLISGNSAFFHVMLLLLQSAKNRLYTRPPNVPPLMTLWSLLDDVWGVLRGCWGVLYGTIPQRGPELIDRRTRIITS